MRKWAFGSIHVLGQIVRYVSRNKIDTVKQKRLLFRNIVSVLTALHIKSITDELKAQRSFQGSILHVILAIIPNKKYTVVDK